MSTKTEKITAGLKNAWDFSRTSLRNAGNSPQAWAALGGGYLGFSVADKKDLIHVVADLATAGFGFAISHALAKKEEEARFREQQGELQEQTRQAYALGLADGSLAGAQRSGTLPTATSRTRDLTAEPVVWTT